MSSRAGGGRLSKAKTGSWGATFVLASSSHPAPTSLPVFRPRACSEGGRGTEKKMISGEFEITEPVGHIVL